MIASAVLLKARPWASFSTAGAPCEVGVLDLHLIAGLVFERGDECAQLSIAVDKWMSVVDRNYLIVRGILTSLTRGRFFSALSEYRQLQSARHLPHDFLYSVSRYWSGRHQRLTAIDPAEDASADLMGAHTRLEPVAD